MTNGSPPSDLVGSITHFEYFPFHSSWSLPPLVMTLLFGVLSSLTRAFPEIGSNALRTAGISLLVGHEFSTITQ